MTKAPDPPNRGDIIIFLKPLAVVVMNGSSAHLVVTHEAGTCGIVFDHYVKRRERWARALIDDQIVEIFMGVESVLSFGDEATLVLKANKP